MAKQANQHTSGQEQIEACQRNWEEETDRVARLLHPLADYLMEYSYRCDLAGVPKRGRTVHLYVKDWPKQYEADVKRCMGFKIKWRGGGNG